MTYGAPRPDGGAPELSENEPRIHLEEVVDLSVLRTLVDASARITGITVAVLNLEGKILLRAEWQDVCAKYHRVNPETCAACHESDTVLPRGIAQGSWKAYRCANGLWDVATPIVVAQQHVGNIFIGQFFFDDEVIDEKAFREKAQRHGFDEESYVAALARVPRWSRAGVATAMEHYVAIAEMASAIGTRNVELGRALIEKERLLASLGESAARNEALFEHSPVAIWEEDLSAVKTVLDGLGAAGVGDLRAYFDARPEEVLRCASLVRVLRINQTTVRVLQAETKENVLLDLPATLSGESVGVFREELVALAGGATQFEGEIPFLVRAGARKTLHIFLSVVPGFERTLGRVLVSFLDVTERHQAEEALRRSEARLRAAAESADLGTWQYDVTTARLRLDERAREHLGTETIDVSVEEAFARVHPQDGPRLRDAVSRAADAAAGEGISDVEFRLRASSGEVRWISISARGTYAGEGPARQAVFVTGTIRDVTARKRAEDSRLRAQKLEALGTLAGGIAHDFNNILFAIRGNASLAAAELPEGHPVRDLVAEIDRAGLRAAALVRQILSFARPEESVRTVLPLTPVVDEVLNLLRSSLPSSVHIGAEWGEDVPPALVDPGQVHQALVNLMTNSAHAIGGRPGRIDVRLSSADVGEETGRIVPGLAGGRYARISVIDDGRGVDPGDLAKVFDPFFTTKPAGQGTGLGLSMVHGIMKAHRGAVTFRSTPAKGTTVDLYFPAAETPVAPVSAPKVAQPGSRSERLLYVDDDEAIVILARRVLGRLGYQVTAFSDPRAAAEEFRAHPDDFDAVITDISMPGMSGFEMAEEVLGIRPGKPVIMTSGYIRREDEEEAERLGVRAVIAKPGTVDELAGALDRILRAAGP